MREAGWKLAVHLIHTSIIVCNKKKLPRIWKINIFKLNVLKRSSVESRTPSFNAVIINYLCDLYAIVAKGFKEIIIIIYTKTFILLNEEKEYATTRVVVVTFSCDSSFHLLRNIHYVVRFCGNGISFSEIAFLNHTQTFNISPSIYCILIRIKERDIFISKTINSMTSCW